MDSSLSDGGLDSRPMIGGNGGGVALVCWMKGGAMTMYRRRGGFRQKPPLRIHAIRSGDSQMQTM